MHYNVSVPIFLISDPSAQDRDCIHIVWFFEEWHWIKCLFPHFFNDNPGDESEEIGIGPGSQEPMNFEDAEIWREAQEFVDFDIDTGLWKSKVG